MIIKLLRLNKINETGKYIMARELSFRTAPAGQQPCVKFRTAAGEILEGKLRDVSFAGPVGSPSEYKATFSIVALDNNAKLNTYKINTTGVNLNGIRAATIDWAKTREPIDISLKSAVRLLQTREDAFVF